MKTIRIKLTKDAATVTCTHVFMETSFPSTTEWSGDRDPFRGPSGRLLSLTDGIDNLENTVAFQANLCGATYTIEDLGGEAYQWKDTVLPPSQDFGSEIR